jgi:phosphatidylserine decarboxylase
MRRLARLQFLLPQRALGRIVYTLARSRRAGLKNLLIGGFCRLYGVDLAEAENPDPSSYASFNAFFTRALRPGARPVQGSETTVACPVDGRLTEFGTLTEDRLLQAKGMDYRLADLLDEEPARLERFVGGRFLTVYLAPHNYHRVHLPVAARLERSRYIAGRRYSVNEATASAIERLYCRNERLALQFSTVAGPLALVMVGALNVASLSTVVHGEIASGPSRDLVHAGLPEFARAAEIGTFNLGSTIVIIFAKDAVEWLATLAVGQDLKLGQAIGRLGAPQSG